MKKLIKNSILIFLCSVIAVLFSACSNGDKYSLSVDENIKSGIDLVIGEDPKSFVVTINNYDEKFSTNFSFNFYDNIAKIDKYEHIGEGKIQVTISGLVGGNTTLRITSYQGSLNLEIPVIVTEKIETITLKQNTNPYLVKGESITFNGEELFTFNPQHTKQKEVEYYLVEGSNSNIKIDNGTLTASNTNVLYFNSNGEERNISVNSYFNVMAVSTYDPLITCLFRVNLINKIEIENVSLIQNNNENLIILENGIYKNNILQFIRNNKNYSKYNFTLSILATNCSIEIYSKNNKFLPEIQNIQEENNNTIIDFSILPLFTGQDEIIIKLADKTINDYYQEFNFLVNSIEIPSGLLLNDIPTGLEIVLFSGQTIENATKVNYSIYPTASYDIDPVLYLQFYKDISKTEQIEDIESLLGVSHNNIELNDFVDLVISNDKKIVVEIVDDEFTILDTTYNINQLQISNNKFIIDETEYEIVRSLKINTLKQDGSVSFWAKSQDQEDFYINFICITNQDNFETFTIENIIKASIKKSASAFYIDSSYTDGKVYIEENSNNNIFKGLRIEPADAYIGEMLFTPIENASEIAEIGQIEYENNLSLDLLITGKKEGEAKYLITLPNSYQTTITINVVKLYKSSADLSFKLLEANPNVAEIQSDINGNITSLIVRRNQERINFSTYINASEETYNYVENVDQKINRFYCIADEVYDIRTGKIQFYTKYIEDFKLVNNENVHEHIFTVTSFEPISNFVLTTENQTVYEQSSLGYFEVQQELHKSKLSFYDISEEKFNQIKDQLSWSFSKSYMTNEIDTDILGNIITITDYGTFDIDTLTFTYSSNSSNISNEIYINVEYKEYDKTYTSIIKLNLKTFVKANEITLKNFVSKINLDIINDTKTLYINIGPENATDKRFIFEYENLEGSFSVNIQVAEDYSNIKVTYNGSGASKGILRLIPISQYINEQEYTYSIEIEIEANDGTRESPILLKNADDFVQAFSTTSGLSKHYQIQEEIDFTGVKVPVFGDLKGSIVGKTDRAKLTGLKISNVKDNYAGLFSKISRLEIEGELVSSLENLKIEACYDFDNSLKLENINVGIVCAVNEGLIKNVSLTLLKSNLTINTSKESYFGIICAENKGSIVFEVYGNDSEHPTKETTIVNVPEGQDLEVIENISGNQSNLFIGGIAGKNTGTIKFDRKDDKQLVTNKFGYSTYINIRSNSNVGGIVGKNEGEISGHLVGGKITFYEDKTNNCYKAGIVAQNEGENAKVINNTTRVFIRSNSYLSGLIANALSGEVKNNTVESIYTSNVSELEIPLLVFKKQTDTAKNDYLGSLFARQGTGLYVEENIAISFHDKYDVMFLDSSNNYKNVDNTLFTNTEFTGKDNKFDKQTLSGGLELTNTNEYLSFYQALNKNEIIDDNGTTAQGYLDKNKNIYSMPYVVDSDSNILKNNLIIESRNSSVVSILENGDFKINSVGSADIIIKSSLNIEYYVIAKLYVSYKVDGYNLYFSAEKNEDTLLLSNSIIELYKGQTFSLYSTIYANPVTTLGHTKIELVSPNNKDLTVRLNLNNAESYVLITSNNGQHVISGYDSGQNQIYGEVVYTNQNFEKVVYSDKYIDENNNEKLSYNFYASYKLGASKITLSQKSISVYPSQEISVTVSVISDDPNEDLTLQIFDSNGYLVTNLFEFEKHQENLTFNFNVKLKDYNNFGNYNFKFVAKNTISVILEVNILAQPITNISVNTYSKYEIDNNSQDLEIADYVEPGSTTNHMTIFVNPYYADYDYIEIINDNINYQTNSQALFTYVGNDTNIQVNYNYINNGIRIYKQSANNSYCNLHILRYVLGSNAQDNSSTILHINAYKDNDIIYSIPKTIKVESLADVTVSLSGRSDNSLNYVAKGTIQSIDINYGQYAIDDIVIESSSNDVVIYKEENRIEIKKSAKSGTVNIASYGTYKVNGRTLNGKSSVLTIRVVDFIFKDDKVTTNTSKISTPLSSILDVTTEITDDINLIYNPSLGGVNASVENFKEKLKLNSVLQLGILNKETNTFDYIDLDKTKSYSYDEFNINYKNNSWIVTPKKVVSSGSYKFKTTFGINYTDTIEVAERGGRQYSIEKDLEITSNSSLNSPLPIRTIEQFYAMEDGKYYILLEDLDFTKSQTKLKPNKAKVAGFNGNNHKIIISSIETSELADGDVQTITPIEYIGLFETIEENAIIQNVNIHIPVVATINVSKYATNTSYVGLLAGQNKGVITNCYVSSGFGAQISANIVEIGVSGTSTYVAGLVGKNDGYITNSRFECNIVSNSHIAGFVGINNNHISSSFVNDAEITNSSTGVNTTNKTAGFVIENNGSIFESYISGGYTETQNLYSLKKILTGKQETASFVYLNKKTIKNCYADISTYGQGKTSGFVFTNDGNIENCYTTSKLKDNSQSSYAFIENGNSIKNCYYASDLNKSIYDYKNNYKDNLIPLTLLSTNEFKEGGKIENFVIAESTSKSKRDYIWFFASLENETEFDKEGTLRFNNNKPMLSSANLIPTSSYEFLSLTTDPVTNEEVYNYIDEENVYGGKFNPIIIYSAESLEHSFATTSTSQNNLYINKKYFRVVKDIDYEEENIVSSNLYSTIFIGELDGNNLCIDNYSINTSKNLTSAGLFSELGNGITKGSIKSLNLKPKYINIPNANIVGSLVGTVNYGNIVEVNVSANNLIVNAKNIAGGVIGRAINTFNLINISSNVSANSTSFTKDFSSNILYNLITDKYTQVSYAGSIAGLIAGEFGYVKNPIITDGVMSIGKIAGLMFGGILDNAKVENIDLEIGNTYSVKAYAYGGLITGHLVGQVNNVRVNQTESVKDLFSNSPMTPIAIGGIAGIMQNSEQTTQISNIGLFADIISTKCYTVGGIVGLLTTDNINGSSLENIKLDAKIQGVACIGGLIGRISPYEADTDEYGRKYQEKNVSPTGGDNNLIIKDIDINADITCDNSMTYSNYLTKYIYIGGLIGQNYSNNKFEYSDEINTENIDFKYNIKAISENVYIYYSLGVGLGNNLLITNGDDVSTPKVNRIGTFNDVTLIITKNN